MYDVLDPHQAQAELDSVSQDAIKKDRQTSAYFAEVFGNDAGKEVLKRINQFCFVNASTFSAENRELTVFREGMRNVALWVHAWLAYEKDMNNAKT